MRGKPAPSANQSSRYHALWLLVIGAAVYANSFRGVLLFDDVTSLAATVVQSSRPLTQWTFALNVALGGLHPWGYHLVNLAIHLATGLVLFGLLRRTLSGLRAAWCDDHTAGRLSFVIALVWLVHPVTTHSVTYISQRAESLMGLCAVLTLWCARKRVLGAPSTRPWELAAVLACLCGMLSKPVMAPVPLLVWLYDGTFGFESFRAAWQARWRFYTALASTWLVLAFVLLTSRDYTASAGWTLLEPTPLAYAAAQPGVLIEYLARSLWPHPLPLDYGWPVTRTAAEIVPAALLVGGWIIWTLAAVRRRRPIGFASAWALLLLAPTSSIIPLLDPAALQRLYLPLAALAAVLVIGTWRLMARRPVAWHRPASVSAAAVVVLTLSILTLRHNALFAGEEAVWAQTVEARPMNARAHNNLGCALSVRGAYAQALPHFQRASALDPWYVDARYNLARALEAQGRTEEAETAYRRSLAIQPRDAQAHGNLGVLLARQSRLEEAARRYAQAIRLAPEDAALLRHAERLIRLMARPSTVAFGADWPPERR